MFSLPEIIRMNRKLARQFGANERYDHAGAAIQVAIARAEQTGRETHVHRRGHFYYVNPQELPGATRPEHPRGMAWVFTACPELQV